MVFSVMLEISLLAEMFTLSEKLYSFIHYIELLLLLILLTAFGILNKSKTAFLFAIGMLFTFAGDVINSSISGISPISLKLKFAIVLFSIGYSFYCYALWKVTSIKINNTFIGKYKYWLLLPIQAISLANWSKFVYPNVQHDYFLLYGTIVVTFFIYALLPLFAIWFLFIINLNPKGFIILIGAILIPYSDALLFYTWLQEDLYVPLADDYKLNFILYYTGQSLISLLPAFENNTSD